MKIKSVTVHILGCLFRLYRGRLTSLSDVSCLLVDISVEGGVRDRSS